MFRNKQKLRKEYDGLLLELMTEAKDDWNRQTSLQNMSFEFNEELYYHTKIAEAKYIFLFREVKKRKIRIK